MNDLPPLGISVLLACQHAVPAVISLAFPVIITLEAGGLVDRRLGGEHVADRDGHLHAAADIAERCRAVRLFRTL